MPFLQSYRIGRFIKTIEQLDIADMMERRANPTGAATSKSKVISILRCPLLRLVQPRRRSALPRYAQGTPLMTCSNSSTQCKHRRRAKCRHVARALRRSRSPALGADSLPEQHPGDDSTADLANAHRVRHRNASDHANLAYSLRPPATSEFSLSLPDGLDAEWPLKWTWKGFPGAA